MHIKLPVIALGFAAATKIAYNPGHPVVNGGLADERSVRREDKPE
jgi:hypothetical protein